MVELQRQALSRDNPWPGLDPFDEADRDYFHGRAAESDDLLRLVRRELLTVLFGRSGLGKTSLLKAGLFPLLRGEDYLPVYLRLDHADGAPALREQIFRELQAAGDADQVQVAQPAGDEALWPFFHRRDAEFWSRRNRLVTPVIVLDQFEEIFTFGQETEEARARSAAFLAELGDLVESRPPEAVRKVLETDPAAARRFDFKRSTVKLVLSFREDFLAEMEGLKEQMPSLMYNRFRLLAMSGAQAYDVITRAGGHLVDDVVARRIIRLSWKNEPSPPVDPSDFPKIEIDPALLSVVCSELNHKRQQAKPPLEHITPALLEGADREILSGFYERGMAGLDPRVRAFVEDELITGSGYRDSHAMEDALALPGVTAEALDALIRRRLLRMDDRQSLRRLELTHDVLTRVVKESRDNRRAREAEETAKAREREALEQQQRNRRNAAFVLAGAVVVIVLAGLALWFATKARQLEKQTEVTRLMGNADRLQNTEYDASLLVNLKAAQVAPTADVMAGLLRRFMSHPHLSAVLVNHSNEVMGVTFSPNGTLLASASSDGNVVLWDLGRRRPLATLRAHKREVIDVAFSPDGKLLASSSSDKSVILWDVDSRTPLATLMHASSVTSVAFSQDGKRLASVQQDAIVIWDVTNRRPLGNLRGHTSWITSIAFSPDGRRLASASDDLTVILWDLDRLRSLVFLRGHSGLILGVTFSPDGRRLASASSNEVIVWDAESFQLISSLEGQTGDLTSISFSPDGERLAWAGLDYSVILWDVRSRKPLATLEGHKELIWDIAFSPDGKLLASAGADQTVILWELNSPKLTTMLKGNDSIAGIAFSPDGKLVATASLDQKVRLRNVEGGLLWEGRWAAVRGIAFSADGKQLAFVSREDILLLDIESRRLRPLGRLRLDEQRRAVRSVAFSPDGTRLAFATGVEVVLWAADSGRLLNELREISGAVLSVAFGPDGKRLACARANEVVLWDVERGRLLSNLKEHKFIVSSIAFDPDGEQLATASQDRTVILWDMESNRSLAKLKGHKGAVLSLGFDHIGKRLATGSEDDTIILWDLDNRSFMATLAGHHDAVLGVAFSLNGKRLASASKDGTIILWDLDPDHLKAEACRTANRNLTCEEWRSYIGADKPYNKTCPELPGPQTCD